MRAPTRWTLALAAIAGGYFGLADHAAFAGSKTPATPPAPLDLVAKGGGGADGTSPCEKSDVLEGEFESGHGCGVPLDDYNGGCNSVPEIYSPLECGQTICGTVGADGSFRDTDWFEFTLTEWKTITWTIHNPGFDWLLYVNGSGLCFAPVVPVGLAVGVAGQSGSITATISPGTYIAALAPRYFDPLDCPSPYRVSLTCAGICTETCEFGIVENEPNCGLPVDTVNGGCNSEPPVFASIECSDALQPICGTVALDAEGRDTDWYVFTRGTECEGSYAFEITAEFPFVAGYVEWEPGFEGSGDCAHVTGLLNPSITGEGDCTPHLLEFTAGAGTHWIFVAPLPDGDATCAKQSRNKYSIVCYGGGGMLADCNQNCIRDNLDIASGYSRDCFDYGAAQPPGGPYVAGGPNGIPDECECVADWNRDGVANSADVGELVNTYFLDQSTGLTTHADIDCNAISNSTDVGEFINIYFAAQAHQLPFAGCLL